MRVFRKGWTISACGSTGASQSIRPREKRCCMEPALQQTLIGAARREKKEESGYIPSEWVDYVLTTANTWKTPIKDFELIVERPRPKPGSPERGQWFVSFCWDGAVTRLDADHFSGRLINFVPKRELHVVFFGVN